MNYKVDMTNVVSQKIASILKDAEKYSVRYKTRLSAKFKKSILSLAEFPYRHPLVSEEPWHSRGIRKMPIKPYVAYYDICEEKKLVSVETLCHGKQNQAAILEGAFGI